MADDVRIDSLSIEIESNVKPAAQSINSLASAVKKFNDAVSKGKGFGDLVSLANSAKTASDNMADAPAKLRDLADALKNLGQASKAAKFSKDLAQSFSDIGNAVKGISANVGQRLNSLAAGLTAIRDVGDVRISPTIGSGITAINDAISGINVNNMSRIGRFVEELRPLQEIGNLSISGNISREIVNIANSAEVIRDVDFTPIRQLSTALGYLAMVDDVRLPYRLADNIINLGIAAMDVQDVDWSVFERMAAGLRHLEGLGQIRIPRIRPTQRRVEDRQENAARDPESVIGGGISDAAERAANDVEHLRGTLQSTNDVQAFANSRSDLDILRLRLTAARDRLQDLLNADTAELNYRAIANATEEVKRLERELATAKGTLGGFMKDAAGGFVKGAGISGVVGQLKDIFSSPGSAIGYGIGAAINGIISAVGRLAGAFRDVGIKAFTTSVNILQSALRGLGSAAVLAGKAVLSFGKTGLKALAGVAKIEFKWLMTLPRLFGESLIKRIKSVASSINGFVRSIGRIAFYRMIRTAIKEVTQAFSEGIKNLYQWSLLVDHTFANSMDKIATSMLYLKNSLGAAVAPIINTLAPAIDFVVDKFVDAINVVNQFLAAITGSQTYTAAKKLATEWAENETEKANKNLKDLKKTILGFDELNILNKDNRTDAQKNGKDVADYKNMFETRNVENAISDFAKKIRDAFNSGNWGSIGQMFADKFNDWISNIDWAGIGVKIGEGVNKIVDAYNGFMERVAWFDFGGNLATALNNIVDTVNWENLGRALSQKLDALSGILLGFAQNFKWGKAGEEFGNTVKGLVNGIDWKQLGKSLGESITGLATFAKNAALTFPWFQIGNNLASGANSLFASLKWNEIADGLIGIMDGALTSLLTFIHKFEWGTHGEEFANGVMQIVNDFPTGKMINAVTRGIKGVLAFIEPTIKREGFWEGLGEKFTGLLNGLFNATDMWESVKRSLGYFVRGALNSLQTIVSGFEWVDNGNKFHDAILGLVDLFPKDELATLLQTALKGALEFIAPTVKDVELFKKIGSDVADFLNKIFKNRAQFKEVGITINALIGNLFTMGQEFVNNFNEKEAAKSISAALREIKWNEIASQAWTLIKSAFAKTGSFLDALLNEDLSDKWGNELYEAAKFNNSSFGAKLGKRISQAIAGINWKQFGNELGAGVGKLFDEISVFFNKIRDDGTLTKAIEDFFSGLPNDLPQKIANAAKETFLAVGQALGKFVLEGMLKVFSFASPLNGKDVTKMDSRTVEAYLGGAGSAFGGVDEDTISMWSKLGESIRGLTGANAAEGEGQYNSDFFNNLPTFDVQEYMTNLQTAFETGWNNIKGIVSRGAQDVVTLTMQPLNNLKDVGIPNVLSGFNTAFTTGFGTVQITVSTAAQNIVTLVMTPLNNLGNVGIPTAMTTFNAKFAEGWSAVQQTVSAAAQNIVTLTMTPLNNLANFIPTHMSTVNGKFAEGWNTVQRTVSTSVQGMVTLTLTSLNNLANVGIPNAMNSIKSTVSNAWYSVLTNTDSTMSNFVGKVQNAVSTASGVSFYSVGSNIVSTLNSGIGGNWWSATSKVWGLANAMYNEMNRYSFYNVGYYLVSGIIDGINGNWGWLTSKAWDLATAAYNSACQALGIASPSKLFSDGVGKMIDLGIVEGVEGSEPAVLNSISDMSKAMSDKMQQANLSAVMSATATTYYAGVSDYVDGIAEAYSADGYDEQYNGMASLINETSRQNDLLRQQNQLLQQLLNKDTTVEISTAAINNANVRANRRAGLTIVPVGT